MDDEIVRRLETIETLLQSVVAALPKKRPRQTATTREQRLAALLAFRVDDAMQAWARTTFDITIPDDAVQEFVDYWKNQKVLHDDWPATFRNRIRYRIEHGWLKPTGQRSLPLPPCQYVNGRERCQALSVHGSKFCQPHRDYYQQATQRFRDRDTSDTKWPHSPDQSRPAGTLSDPPASPRPKSA